MNDIIHTALPRWINFDGQIQPVRPRGFSLEARPGTRLELTISGPFSTEGAAKQILARLAFLINGLAASAVKPVSRSVNGRTVPRSRPTVERSSMPSAAMLLHLPSGSPCVVATLR
jgi:hypothetical protein